MLGGFDSNNLGFGKIDSEIKKKNL